MNDPLELQKKQLRTERAILVIVIIILILLLLLLFRGCRCNCGCNGSASDVIKDNIIRVLPGGEGTGSGTGEGSGRGSGTGQGSGTGTGEGQGTGEGGEGSGEGSGEGGGGGGGIIFDDDDDDDEEEEAGDITLSDGDAAYVNNPFDELFYPGDTSEPKTFAVEVQHKKNVAVHFGLSGVEVYASNGQKKNLSSVMNTPNSALDIINVEIKIKANDEADYTRTYTRTLKELINNSVTYPLGAGSTTDIVKYELTASIPTTASDDLSDDTDGNYQDMQVKFSLKWWLD